MEIKGEFVQKNQYREPCACAAYVNIKGIKPFCDNPKSAYYMRCPPCPCELLDSRMRAEMLEQSTQNQVDEELEHIASIFAE